MAPNFFTDRKFAGSSTEACYQLIMSCLKILFRRVRYCSIHKLKLKTHDNIAQHATYVHISVHIQSLGLKTINQTYVVGSSLRGGSSKNIRTLPDRFFWASRFSRRSRMFSMSEYTGFKISMNWTALSRQASFSIPNA